MVASRGRSLAVRGSDLLEVVSLVLLLDVELLLVSVVEGVVEELVLGSAVVGVVVAGVWPSFTLLLL